MNFEPHMFVFYAITAVAAVAWLCGLLFLLNTQRMPVSPTAAWDDDEAAAEPGEACLRGSAEVDGAPAELAAKAAAQLAQQGVTTIGPVRILEQTDRRVVFESAPHLGGQFFRRGVLDFEPLAGNRTRIDYAVVMPRRHGLLLTAWIVQALGLIVLVVGFVAIREWVASDPNPAIRWQSVQMVHVVHFLWPPFLFAGIYRRVRRHVRSTFDNLVHNLPYVQG